MTRPLTPEGEALLDDEMHGRFQAAIDDAYLYDDLTEEMFHDRLAAVEQAAVARLVARLSRLPRTSIRDGTGTGRMVVDWADLSAVLADVTEEPAQTWDHLARGPDCPHHCEEGHLTGDDMAMAEIGTGWPARWEAAIAERERLLRRLRSMIEDPMVDTPTLLDEVDRMLARVGDDR